MFPRLLLASPLLVVPLAASAQTGGTAHLYAYHLSDRAAFERGYRQHLRWHAARADKLAWFAWYVIAGDRAGAFVDGTFGTTPAGLAGRPDPKGDGADFRANAAPFARAMGDEGWELWPGASRATPLERRRPGALIRVYVVETADPAAFETAVAARPLPGATWYRATDGAAARYLLMAPTRTAAAPAPLPADWPAQTVRAETWRYAPRLALMPGRSLFP